MLHRSKNKGFALVEAIVTLAIAAMTVLLLSSVMNATVLQEERYACRLGESSKQLMQLHYSHPVAKSDRRAEIKNETTEKKEIKQTKQRVIKETIHYQKKESVSAQKEVTLTCPQGEERIQIEQIQTKTTRISSY